MWQNAFNILVALLAIYGSVRLLASLTRKTLAKSGSWVSPATNKPEQVKLNLVREVYITDSWDGETTCSDGLSRNIILYEDQVVASRITLKDEGSTEGRTKSPYWEFWDLMAYTARVHLALVKIARIQYFREKPPERPDWDSLYISEGVMKILESHPAHRETVDGFGLELEPLSEDRRYKVKVTKFADSEQAA